MKVVFARTDHILGNEAMLHTHVREPGSHTLMFSDKWSQLEVSYGKTTGKRQHTLPDHQQDTEEAGRTSDAVCAERR